MKKICLASLMLFLPITLSITNALACSAVSEVFLVNENGSGMSVGTVEFIDTPRGLEIRTNLKGLPPGNHGFHIHEHPSCAPCAPGEHNDKRVPAIAAGGHYDPDKTGKHEGPLGNGHKGDLPVLVVKKDGTAKETLYAPRLTAKEIKGRSLMIHAGGDNYSDKPLPLGGGGARIACGIIK